MNRPSILVETPVKHDIVVVGASAGGVRALQLLIGGLNKDFQGAILAVVHMPPWAASNLASILGRCCSLPVIQAAPDQQLEMGHIYVAAPDFHLILQDHRVVRWRGPAEDHHRPSINALFRSAAVTYGPRVTGVVLTGALNDGTTGLWWVKRFGGVTVVQNPDEAELPDMPRSALAHVDIDYVLGVSEMGALLSELANGNARHASSLQAKAAQERLKWR